MPKDFFSLEVCQGKRNFNWIKKVSNGVLVEIKKNSNPIFPIFSKLQFFFSSKKQKNKNVKSFKLPKINYDLVFFSSKSKIFFATWNCRSFKVLKFHNLRLTRLWAKNQKENPNKTHRDGWLSLKNFTTYL